MFGTRTVIIVISAEFSNPGLDLDLAAFSQRAHSWTGGRSYKSSVVGMLPLSWCMEGREGRGEEGKSMFSEKRNSAQTSLSIFVYAYIEMWVGAESWRGKMLGQNY